MENEVKILWLVAVGNGWLWLTPCKRMKLRRSEWAQLGDCTKGGMKRGYEPRRGSVMVKTIDTTTTDRLRRSPLYLDLSPSCARKRACTICRFQRLKNPHFRLFQCSRLWHVSLQTVMYQRIGNMPKACPYVMMRFLRYDAIFTNRCKIYFRLFRWFGK